jgi:hypothetical protein
MDVDAIRAYLVARIDEDEQAAQSALWAGYEPAGLSGHERWRTFHRSYDDRWVVEDDYNEGVAEVRAQAADSEGVARYVVRHEPARSLREVRAKRRRLERHTAFIRSASGLPYCNHCSQDSYGEDWPCGDLVDDAQSWADRDDFPEELKLP